MKFANKTGVGCTRPRLLVLASTYPRWPGDPEPGFVHELSKRMVEWFDVIVVCPHTIGAKRREFMDGVQVERYRYAPASLESLVNNGGITTNLVRYPWKWLLVPTFLLGLAWATARLMHRSRVDIIHAHWLIPQGCVAAFAALLRRRHHFVVTSHGADLFALRAPIFQILKRFVVRRASAITVVSEAMKNELVAIGADVGRVTVQPMGVDLADRFTPVFGGLHRATDEILFVGRLVEKKGLRDLVSAMPAILEQRPAAVLTIVGFGPELATVKALATDLGLSDHVHFLGPRSQADLPALYRRAAVFVAPFTEAATGDREGLGLVLVEALGCGCPVVTTYTPAVREVFGGWPEYVADPGSPSSLAAQVVRVLNGQSAARAWVERQLPSLRDRFEHSRVAAGYADLLQAAIVDSPR